MNELATMLVEKQEVSNIGFGGHHLTINCNNPLGGKVAIAYPMRMMERRKVLSRKGLRLFVA
jgi:hypothetical protein